MRKQRVSNHLSLKLKRGAKSAALGIVTSRSSTKPDPISTAALRMMKIGLEPGLPSHYQGGTRGAACISVDFDVTSKERYPWNHDGTMALLRLSEAHGIPLTWAICGMTAEKDPRAYDAILGSPVKQEVGVHTYSHIYAGEASEGDYEEDIEKCIRVLGLPVRPRTFVFPKNKEGYFPLLKRLGFTSYRGARRVIGAPVKNEGLWNIRPVYYVDQKSLRASGLVKRFVDVCVARSAVFHLWTHPWSLAIEGQVDRMISGVLEPAFAYMDSLRKSGFLSVGTMGELSSFLGPPA